MFDTPLQPLHARCYWPLGRYATNSLLVGRIGLPASMMVQLVADSSSALTAGVAAGVAADDRLEAAAIGLETFVLRKEGTGASGGTPAVSGSLEPA